jgi:hypothetical protein
MREDNVVDRELADTVSAPLGESDRVDDRRILVTPTERGVALKGAVATPEEMSAAALVAEHYAGTVDNQLYVDRNLREGQIDPQPSEHIVPAEDEVLIGDTDMLAGTEKAADTDLSQALEGNVPWDPPDEPHLAVPEGEYGSNVGGGPPSAEEEDVYTGSGVGGAAADLSAADLERAPALDPDAVAPPSAPSADPRGEDLGDSPPEPLEPMVDRIPGTASGPGAVSDNTSDGGAVGRAVAAESGAKGADTAGADPVRSTGATMTDSGTERGPEARDNEAVREDFPARGAG